MRKGILNWHICLSSMELSYAHGSIPLTMKKGKLSYADKNLAGSITEIGNSASQNEKSKAVVSGKIKVFKKVNSKKTAFSASTGDKVTVLGFCYNKGKMYIELKSKNGKKGFILNGSLTNKIQLLGTLHA